MNRSPSNFIAYARPCVNGAITHYLRDKGFLISVPGRWRELHARGQKLLRKGRAAHAIPERLGITDDRWAEICQACAVRVVAMPLSDAEEQENCGKSRCGSWISYLVRCQRRSPAH